MVRFLLVVCSYRHMNYEKLYKSIENENTHVVSEK